MTFETIVTGSDHSEHRAREPFECPLCEYRGTLVIEALAVVTHTAAVPSESRRHDLEYRAHHGGLGSQQTAELRQLERASALAAGPGGLQGGLSVAASRGARAAAERRAQWLAGTARCPRCAALRPARAAPYIREEIVRGAQRVLQFVGVVAVASVVVQVFAAVASPPPVREREGMAPLFAGVSVFWVLCATLLAAAGAAGYAWLSARARLRQPIEDERRFEPAA